MIMKFKSGDLWSSFVSVFTSSKFSQKYPKKNQKNQTKSSKTYPDLLPSRGVEELITALLFLRGNGYRFGAVGVLCEPHA